MEGGDEAEEEADGEDEDAQGDGFVAPIDEEKGAGEEEAEEGLSLVGVDWEAMVGGVEHLGEGDEVEEDGGDGGGDGDVTPARAVVEGSGQNRERGYAVEEDRDSEPEEGHDHRSPAAKPANLQYIGYGGGLGWIDGLIDGLPRLCETHEYAIQRKGGVCPGTEDAGAEYASLPAGALAYMDMGVLSGAGSADVYVVCAWVWAGQSGVAGGGAGGDGRGGVARAAAGRGAEALYSALR